MNVAGFWNIFQNPTTCSLMRDNRKLVLDSICTDLDLSFEHKNRIRVYIYSGSPPYDHPVYTATSLLRPLYSGPNKSSVSLFLILKNPLNSTTPIIRPDFCGPLVIRLMGLHCNRYDCHKWIKLVIIYCLSSSTSPTSIPYCLRPSTTPSLLTSSNTLLHRDLLTCDIINLYLVHKCSISGREGEASFNKSH